MRKAALSRVEALVWRKGPSELGPRPSVRFWLPPVFKVWATFLFGPFLLSRLKHLGLTDATLCFGEIGLWLFADSKQVCNGEIKNACPHYNWTIYCSCRINVFFLHLRATLIKLRLSLCACSVYLCVGRFFSPCCWGVWLILLLFPKVILRFLQPLSFKISHSWRDFHLPLISRRLLRQRCAPLLPPQVTRTRSVNHLDANRKSQATVELRAPSPLEKFGLRVRENQRAAMGVLPQVEQMLPVISIQSLQPLTFPQTRAFACCAQARRCAGNQNQAWEGNLIIPPSEMVGRSCSFLCSVRQPCDLRPDTLSARCSCVATVTRKKEVPTVGTHSVNPLPCSPREAAQLRQVLMRPTGWGGATRSEVHFEQNVAANTQTPRRKAPRATAPPTSWLWGNRAPPQRPVFIIIDVCCYFNVVVILLFKQFCCCCTTLSQPGSTMNGVFRKAPEPSEE